MNISTVSVIGLGYIGLPTAAILASHGKRVIGVDVNQHAVDTINKGMIHIVEPDLEVAVKNAVDNGNLRATSTPEPADAFVIAVPTPFRNNKENGDQHEPDLTFIKSASKMIAPVLTKGNLVILESTSPVGATEQMAQWLAEMRPDLSFPQNMGDSSDIKIAYCPERVLPGKVMQELIENDRVIGGMTQSSSEAAIALYKSFVNGECFETNSRTAEMAKLTENSFRDVNIAFANELSLICDSLDINVWELIKLANRHPRVNILQPGPGVGGHCIAVDPWFIVSKSPEHAKIIKTAREVNDFKPYWVIDKVKSAIADIVMNDTMKKSSDIVIACYGLAFKPDIDDLRESPALNIAKKLINIHPGQVLLIEPNIEHESTKICQGKLVNFEYAAKHADIHILLVDHKEFKGNKPQSGIIVDTKGVW